MPRGSCPAGSLAKIRLHARNRCLNQCFVLEVPGTHGDEVEVVPAKHAADSSWMHLLPEAVADATPRAATGVPHLHKVGAENFEDVKDHANSGDGKGAGLGMPGLWLEADEFSCHMHD